MNALANFGERWGTLAGVTGGALSWIAGNMKLLTEVASCVGAVCGALVAVISLSVKAADALRQWRRRRARRLQGFTVPPYVDDTFPGEL